ncbi:MAG: hypothetical protein D6739_03785 [Nitrospirae bacterium]|nr:MAG: hypothetical protein D6739_03785 [Nitrospirota bacterium]
MAIDAEDYEAIWPLRRQREVVTGELAAECARLAATGDADGPLLERLHQAAERIAHCDRRNRSQLETRCRHLAGELQHLGDGRRAVAGYRVPAAAGARYVDRTG